MNELKKLLADSNKKNRYLAVPFSCLKSIFHFPEDGLNSCRLSLCTELIAGV